MDLTKQPIFRAISLFALPMLLENMLQQLYNVVDIWIVGRYINSGALAAVGAVFALMVFLTSVLLAKLAVVTTIGVVGIWWAIPIGWLLADLVGILCYRKKFARVG